jgi:hypothetical protein
VNNTGFLMKDWWVWKSKDLVKWSQASVVHPATTLKWATPGEQTECWATDGAFKNNVYYFYLSVGPGTVGVITAPDPTGPWSDPLGKPLLGPNLVKGATFRDPAVLQDDDGSNYIIAGVFDYYMAKLGDDMVSLAEPMKKVVVNNALGTFGPGKTDDKPFIHKYNGTYYLSWGCFYGTSQSPYGPYDYQGSAIRTEKIDKDFRMPADTGKPWYAWQDLTDRHGSFWTKGGQWFFASNDRSHSKDTGHEGVFRDTVIGYVHYFANGTIAPVVINAQGVGTYHASASATGVAEVLIEAENFFELIGSGYKLDLDNGNFGMHSLAEDSELHFPYVESGRVVGTGGDAMLTLRVTNTGNGATAVNVWTRPGGMKKVQRKHAGECVVPPAAGADFATVQCKLHIGSEEMIDLALEFGVGASGLQLDSLVLGAQVQFQARAPDIK